MTDGKTDQKASGTGTAILPKGPTGLALAEVQALDKTAEEHASKLVANPADRELVDMICNIGRGAQASAAGEMDLLKVRVRDMLKNADGADAAVVKGLVDMRQQLRNIDPFIASEIKWYQRFFSWFPGYNPMAEALSAIASRWDSVEGEIKGIEKSLGNGQEALSGDVSQLRALSDRVTEKQKEVRANGYLAEQLYSRVENALATIDDEAKRKKVQEVMYDIQLRVQVLRNMDLANEQFLAEISLVIRSNQQLIRSVDNTLQITPNVLTIALAIQATQQRQKKIAAAVKATDDYTASVMVQTARSTGQGAEEIEKIYANGVVCMEKLMEAQKLIMTAMDKQDQDRIAALTAGKKILETIESSTKELVERREGQTEGATDVKSLEANVSQLTDGK